MTLKVLNFARKLDISARDGDSAPPRAVPRSGRGPKAVPAAAKFFLGAGAISSSVYAARTRLCPRRRGPGKHPGAKNRPFPFELECELQ